MTLKKNLFILFGVLMILFSMNLNANDSSDYVNDQSPSAGGDLLVKHQKTIGNDSRFQYTSHVAVNGTGHIFVSDETLCRISVFSPEGIYLFNISKPDVHFYSIAFNNTGHIFISDLQYTKKIYCYDSTGNFLHSWGSNNMMSDFYLNRPAQIAVNGSGYIYVVDNGNRSVRVFSSSGEFIRKWGVIGTNDGEFESPMGITINSTGFVYVSDLSRKDIQVFSSTGEFIRKWGSSYLNPQCLSVNQTGHIFLANGNNNSIQIFDMMGNLKHEIRNLDSPNSIAISPDNSKIYYVEGDETPNNVCILKLNGEYEGKIGQYNYEPGQFDYDRSFTMKGMAINSSGYLYVNDMTNNERIQIFSPQFEFVSSWKPSYTYIYDLALSPSGLLYMTTGNDNYSIDIYTQSGLLVSQFGADQVPALTNPKSIAINNTGQIFVGDYDNCKIFIFSPQGVLLDTWDLGQTYPAAIAINSTGYVYVLDDSNYNMTIYSPNGQKIRTWGSIGSNSGEFNYPRGLALNALGQVIIADTDNSRIQLFDCWGNYKMQWGQNGVTDEKFVDPVKIAVYQNQIYVQDARRIQIFAVGEIPIAPILITQNQTITQTNFTLAWQSVPYATTYQIYVNGVLNSTTSDISGVIHLWTNGTYLITIVAINLFGESPQSTSLEIIVALPGNGSNDDGTSGDPNSIPYGWIYAGIFGGLISVATIVILKKKNLLPHKKRN